LARASRRRGSRTIWAPFAAALCLACVGAPLGLASPALASAGSSAGHAGGGAIPAAGRDAFALTGGAIASSAGVHTGSATQVAARRAGRRRHHRARSRPARPRLAHAAIVGGTQISIEQAPWQVAILAHLEKLVLLCGGSILDELHILTAAHCVFEGNLGEEKRTPVGDFEVIAGTSDLGGGAATAQVRGVARLRVHPYFEPALGVTGGDDVAVLELTEPLNLEPLQPGSAVSAIPLGAPGASPPEGAQVNLTGFGSESETEAPPDGKLYSLGMALGFSRACGGAANALFLCASVTRGTACHGDSGSGLTIGGSTPTLVGATDFLVVASETEFCPSGSIDGFVDLAAAEIREFIEGSETPPRAPRGGGASISGMPVVGQALSCEPGSWSEHPTFSFAFIDSASGRALQSGPLSTYRQSEADVGRAILCEVWAANAGGTGIGRTQALPPVTPATVAAPVPSSPPPRQAVAGEGGKLSTIGTRISVTGGAAIVKVACRAPVRCRGKLTLTAERAAGRGGRKTTTVVPIGSASVSIAANRTSTFKIQLARAGRALLRAAHGRLVARLLIVQLEPAGASPLLEGVQLVQRARLKGK
jgi:hypothetical protein